MPHMNAVRHGFQVIALLCATAGPAWAYRLANTTVVVHSDAPPLVRLAGEEICRYAYLLSSTLPQTAGTLTQGTVAIVLRTGPADAVPREGPDPSQNYALYIESNKQIVHGDSDISTLWAAYHLIQSWGVGFYLGGDALPPPDPNKDVEFVRATCSPALTIRGNLPWFNFLNSPTTWNPQDYKTFFSQMAKQRANFIGFHVYDHEPFCAYDVTPAEGSSTTQAKMGGPLMTTISPHRWWSPPAMSTKDFLFGTGMFFDRGEWGCEVGIEDAWTYAPGRATRLQQAMMADALNYARRVGLKTCIGFEVTGNPEEPVAREAFKRRLTHVLATYPLDYFWIWQSEGRGTAGQGGNWVAGAPNDESIKTDAQIARAFAYLGPQHDLREAARITRYVVLAHETLKELAPRTRLIVSGWGGDAHMHFSTLYEGLDKVVPPDVIFAALDNIDPRLQDHVSETYGKLAPSRERWPIPWFESDGGYSRCDQTGPQTNVTAFEPLLKDIVKKNCQGALGIHWRTRNVEDVAGYLYRFGWNPQLTAAEFFAQYSRDQYGADDAEYMAKVHLRLEELGPQYVGAVGCVECSTPFTWFVKSGSAELGREPNRAGHLPDADRFPELEKLADDLMRRAETARTQERDHAVDGSAAVQYHDLAQMIRWLVIRARVGLAIWNDAAPLAKRLREAEALYEKGETASARDSARSTQSELRSLDFQPAMQALAGTCRTRGELGMLATANARYGRFYAAFVRRLERVLGQPLDERIDTERWPGEKIRVVFPIPAHVAVEEPVWFDGVLMPTEAEASYQIEVRHLRTDSSPATVIPMPIIGGACRRAVFHPSETGIYCWSLVSRSEPTVPITKGAFTVTEYPSTRPITAARPLRPSANPR